MSAVISGDYRYHLMRDCGFSKTMAFIMLNPSTADATLDDPTIRRCRYFAKKHERSLEVINLFAYRTAYPEELWRAQDPVGPLNDDYIATSLENSDVIVAAWGKLGPRGVKRVCEVWNLIRLAEIETIHCLGVNKDGSPKHPLYLPNNSQLVPILR